VIILDNPRALGPLIRQLRHDRGLTLAQLGARAHVTKGGMHKRETDCRAMPVAALVETLAALGYDLALIDRSHRGELATNCRPCRSEAIADPHAEPENIPTPRPTPGETL